MLLTYQQRRQNLIVHVFQVQASLNCEPVVTVTIVQNPASHINVSCIIIVQGFDIDTS